jgi:ADP-ribosylglycohydrolase/protein-tyrosine phosphatase
MSNARTAPRIDWIDVPPGRLGLQACPRTNSVALEQDLRAIRDSGARAVVTLLSHDDVEWLDLGGIGVAAEALGLEWHHVPIQDLGVPDVIAEARWFYTSARLRRLIASGGSAVLHCHAGLGRAGTIAARLLIELGDSPKAAIRRVQTARPGTIESDRQREHLARMQAGGPIAVGPTLDERVLGCLLGGAVGDGLGYAVEFSSLAEIRCRFGEQGLRAPVYEEDRLVVSDDTQMTMFTAEGLICAHEWRTDRGTVSIVGAVWRAYLRWLRTQGEASTARIESAEEGWLVGEKVLWHRRAPGNTCLSALRARSDGSPGRARNDRKGCGGVMRVAPVGLLPEHFDAERAFDLAADVAALTHGHPSGYLSAGTLATLVRLTVDGVPLKDAGARALQPLEARAGHEETSAMMKQALELASKAGDPARDVATLGLGWVGEEALGIGVYAAIVGQDFEDTVAIAANHDGDSDSTASIAGQIRGAAEGVFVIPHAWIRRLDVFDPLVTLAHDLAALSKDGVPLLRRYPAN